MKERPKIKYPCTKCKRQQPCSYKDCQEYMAWFAQEWKDIQEAARRVKEKKLRRIKW